jgi:uncharacterized protein (UPF0128 family)
MKIKIIIMALMMIPIITQGSQANKELLTIQDQICNSFYKASLNPTKTNTDEFNRIVEAMMLYAKKKTNIIANRVNENKISYNLSHQNIQKSIIKIYTERCPESRKIIDSYTKVYNNK